jgi:hypothetical protein
MPTNTETLIASLTAVGESGGWYADSADSRYVDWSSRTSEGEYVMEVGVTDGDIETVRFEMTRDELVALHAALTLTLLANQEA